MYLLLRKILFLFDAEFVHVYSLRLLSLMSSFGLLRLFLAKRINSPVTVMGIEFPNAVGLAAGLDKDAKHIDALSQCGFGFIEVGTVTPLAQSGNDKPRLFRLEADSAIINRMGFNNEGVKSLIANVKKSKVDCVLGINIGKNKDTPLEKAVDDYLTCMRGVYIHADYITINISSPNTPGLRELQHGDGLSDLLMKLKAEQRVLHDQYQRYVPLAVKIAPDLLPEEVREIADRLLLAKIDAVIATNTTNSRPDSLACRALAEEQGGLSGKPVYELSNEIIKQLVAILNDEIPIIAVGGISSAEDAQKIINAGARLVQIYTGFIYSGPRLINETVKKIR